LIIKGLDNQAQVSKYVCLIIKSLDTQTQKLNHHINQYPKKSLTHTLGLYSTLLLTPALRYAGTKNVFFVRQKTKGLTVSLREAERKTESQLTTQKVQHFVADNFRKHDKLTKKAKGTDRTGKKTLDQEVQDDETEAVASEETTMVLMMREVLTVKVSVKVSVTNTHADVTVISRAWYVLQTLS